MKKNQKKANIKELSFREIPLKGIEVNLNIKGFLPNSSWELLQESISFNKERKEVNISIIAERNQEAIAFQVIKEFEKKIPLTFQTGGKWSVQCNACRIEIEVQEEE